MKKQKTESGNTSEIDYLKEKVGLEREEMLILSYLKGFNRKALNQKPSNP